MRHIFDPSPGFSLERMLAVEPENRETATLPDEPETTDEVLKDSEAKPEPDRLLATDPKPDKGIDLLESATKSSPRTLARFLELWTLRTKASEARLIQAKALLYCGLPYRRTRERTISRSVRLSRTRRITITLAATEDGVELPYGADRTLLAWLQTRGFESGVVELASIQEYFRAFGLYPSGREYKRLQAALRRIAGLALVLEGVQGHKRVRRQYAILSTNSKGGLATSLPKRRNRQGSGPWRITVPLDPDFWVYLQQNAVALPFDLLRSFRHRAKAWDLVAFVLHRCAIAKTPSVVPWPDLVEQLGTEDHCPRRLRRTLARVLDEIRVVYPRFPAEFDRKGGLAVGPWGSD